MEVIGIVESAVTRRAESSANINDGMLGVFVALPALAVDQDSACLVALCWRRQSVNFLKRRRSPLACALVSTY